MRVSSQMQYKSRTQMEESKVYKEFMKKQAVGKTENKDKEGKTNTETMALGENLEVTKENDKMVVSQEGIGHKSVKLKEYDIQSEIGKQLVDLFNRNNGMSDSDNSTADDLARLNSSIKTMSLTNYL